MSWDTNPGGRQDGPSDFSEMIKDKCNMRKESL